METTKAYISSHQDFEQYLGQSLGTSDWQLISQEQINKFGEATLDNQWIHTQPERAAAESPFGGTIAHGYLTIALLPHLWAQVIRIENVKMQINYGIEQLRFNQPVKAESRVRLHATLEDLKDLRGISKATIGVKLEIEGEKKPAYTGTITFLYHFNK
jgi:acyl dehydratase